MGIRTDLGGRQRRSGEEERRENDEAGGRSRPGTRAGRLCRDGRAHSRPPGRGPLGKPAGRYVTLELPPLARDVRPAAEALAAELRRLLRLQPGQGWPWPAWKRAVTPDAPGRCAWGLFLTRHLIRHLPEQFGGVRPAPLPACWPQRAWRARACAGPCAMCAGLRAAVDAPAAAPDGLCRTFQLGRGHRPAGVGNARAALQSGRSACWCSASACRRLDAGTLGGPAA